MARWLVQLIGSTFDLEELPFWFPDGQVHALAEGKDVFMVGSEFESLADAHQVRALALQRLDEFSAAIVLLQPSFRRPELGNVFRESEDGTRQGTAIASATVGTRSKLHGRLHDAGADGLRLPTQAQTLLAASRSDSHLKTAMLLWADPVRTWPRLYRVLEEVEKSLKEKRADSAGLCSRSERDLFRRTANAAEVAGKDARHALGRSTPPAAPMSLADAIVFVAKVLDGALRRAAKLASSE